MKTNQNNDIALFRYSVIVNLLNGNFTESSKKEYFKNESKIERTYIDGTKIKVPETTIERWYYKYIKDGYDGLLTKRRVDIGKIRKLNNDTINHIATLIHDFPRLNAKTIYGKLIADNYIDQNKVSYSTINRCFKSLKNNDVKVKKQMLRYECKYANDVWCADSSFGLYLYKNNEKIKLCIIAFIDDASRMILSAKIHESDNISNLLSTYYDATSKYGIPKVLNVDNGKNYRSNSLAIVNAKLAVSVHFDPIHSPTSKAKIERFFRTLKDQWMSTINFRSFKSIQDFQSSLDNYIAYYNSKVHSSLNNLTPKERFMRDLNYIRYLNVDKLNNAFLLEISRKASFDSLITLNDVWYQLPHKFSNKKVTILYSFDCSKVYVLDNDSKVEIFKLDKVANSKIKREYRFSKED